MNEPTIKIKLSHIIGLKPVVLEELKKLDFEVLEQIEELVYIVFQPEDIIKIKNLKSVTRAYIVVEDEKYNPAYIANHKSILGNLIDLVIEDNQTQFKTFKINCAGNTSKEIKQIRKYVKETYNLEEKDEADLKIHIIKTKDVWEVGIQITARPLSVREYKVEHMSGAMDPTIAYAVNSFCNLETTHSYLNIFSGSATLLIEAGLSYLNIQKLIGFDSNKKHLSLSIQNIKKAGLIDKVQVKEKNIFDKPDFGTFDVIVSDLPFGMSISKDEDLENLYKTFVEYCEEKLEQKGRLVIYTSEYERIESILSKSKFKIIQSLQLKFITNANTYLKTKIIVCELQ